MIPKEKCEEMLDKEASRVAFSILQLINSIEFKPNELFPDTTPELLSVANKIANAFKEVINSEVRNTFKI